MLALSLPLFKKKTISSFSQQNADRNRFGLVNKYFMKHLRVIVPSNCRTIISESHAFELIYENK